MFLLFHVVSFTNMEHFLGQYLNHHIHKIFRVHWIYYDLRNTWPVIVFFQFLIAPLFHFQMFRIVCVDVLLVAVVS